jgi:hypothetical protein
MGGRATSIVVIALTVAAAGLSAAGSVSVEAANIPLLFGFSVRPSRLSRTKPEPVQVLVSGRYATADGSHVPALDELELELDRHLILDVSSVPICDGGGRDIRREVLEACEDAVVGKGTIEAELAYPEQAMTFVSGDLTIYNRGRKPGGADLAGYAFLPPPIGAIFIPIKVRKNAGRYGWKARLEVPRLAGGAGSITSYSAALGKRIFSATCARGRLGARAVSTFVDGARISESAIRTCSVAEPHVRQ